jgi:CheY-like chemotaxis protein
LDRSASSVKHGREPYPGVVLLVEDDDNDVVLVQRAFRRASVANPVAIARDGDQAVAYLDGKGEFADREKHPLPVVILLDLKLPRRSGLEVLEWMRGVEWIRRIPVVILTSSRESVDVNKAYDLGANSYLVKPVTFKNLLELITQLNLYWLVLNEGPEVPDR